MKKIKAIYGVFLTMLVIGVVCFSCSKSDDDFFGSGASSQRQFSQETSETMIDSVFVNDSLPNRTYSVYDECRSLLGTITVNSQNRLLYTNQTSSTLDITGTTTMTFTKGQFYYLKPSGCSTKILKVKFATGFQSMCSTFTLSSCTWTYSAGGCTIINSYSIVGVLPPVC